MFLVEWDGFESEVHQCEHCHEHCLHVHHPHLLLVDHLEEENASVSLLGLLGVDNSGTELGIVETEGQGEEGSYFLIFFLIELDSTFFAYHSLNSF